MGSILPLGRLNSIIMRRAAWARCLFAVMLIAAGCGRSFFERRPASDDDSLAGRVDAPSAAMVNPAPATRLFVGANFWNIAWEGQADFFRSNVDFATATNPWDPQFLADLAPYRVLRFMDWTLTNDDPNPQADWSTRRQTTDPQDGSVAFEWQIDLCNRTLKDYWVNVPHRATPAYWTQLAGLIQAQLDPRLRVYVEFSNEVWNSGFPQHRYALQQGDALSLPGRRRDWSYYVYASVRLFEAFEAVFGKGNPRLVKVLSGQAGSTGPCEGHMSALADATINPNHTEPDVYAIAPYFVGATIEELRAAIPVTKIWVESQVACAAKQRLPVIAYEGGADSYGGTCAALQIDPEMHALYTAYLDAMLAGGLRGPFVHYTHSGACWGLKPRTSDSTANSPKYRGVLDWLAPRP
jgi:hypothetical protein